MELVAHDGDHGGVCGGGGEEELLLLEANNVDRSWRLNFDELRLSSENNKEKEKSPSRGLHDCLGVLSKFL